MIVEFSMPKVMTEKDIDRDWIMLGRTLAVRNIPGFGNVADIVIELTNHGLVDIANGEGSSKSCYRVSWYGLNLIKKQQDSLF